MKTYLKPVLDLEATGTKIKKIMKLKGGNSPPDSDSFEFPLCTDSL